MNTPKHHQSQNILILGAGELGMAVLAGFLAERSAHPAIALTVLLRQRRSDGPEDEERRARFSALGVKVITGDFSQQSAAELAAIFRDYDAVINCSGFVGGKGTQLKITQAVLDAGVKRYVPWQFGVDYDQIGRGSGQPVWDEQLAVRDMLRQQQRTHWLIVSTGIFTSYLFEPDFGVVDFPQRKVNALGDADYAVTLTTPEDIGRLTANIFLHQPVIRDRIVYVAGDTITYRRLAQQLSDVYHTAFQLIVLPKQQLRAEAAAAPEDAAAAYRLSFARAQGVAWDKASTFNEQHHIPVMDVHDWLQQRAANTAPDR